MAVPLTIDVAVCDLNVPFIACAWFFKRYLESDFFFKNYDVRDAKLGRAEDSS